MDRGVLLHSPAVRDDPALPAYIRDMTVALGDYSLLVAPLRWNGRSIGTIDIARNPPRAFCRRAARCCRPSPIRR